MLKRDKLEEAIRSYQQAIHYRPSLARKLSSRPPQRWWRQSGASVTGSVPAEGGRAGRSSDASGVEFLPS